MTEISLHDDGTIDVVDGDQVLVYTPYAVTAPDGTTISHESRGGSMVSVWATSVGEAFVEVSHLGHGPAGGELVMVVTRPGHTPAVALGALVTEPIPPTVAESWPPAVDLAVGLIVEGTLDSGSKDDVEDYHQRLLKVWFGHD